MKDLIDRHWHFLEGMVGGLVIAVVFILVVRALN